MFIQELCDHIGETIRDLEPHQVHQFYEAAGWMVSAAPTTSQQEALTCSLMDLPMRVWRRYGNAPLPHFALRVPLTTISSASLFSIVDRASNSPSFLKNKETQREIQRILRTFTHAAKTIGTAYAAHMREIYMEMLHVYKGYSDLIASA